jgi:hypothetical protein
MPFCTKQTHIFALRKTTTQLTVNNIFVFREIVVQLATLRGDIRFRYLKQFFVIQPHTKYH